MCTTPMTSHSVQAAPVLIAISLIVWQFTSKNIGDARWGIVEDKKTLMIVLYYFRKQRSGHVNKLNRYWISTSYQVGNRRTLKVSKTP